MNVAAQALEKQTTTLRNNGKGYAEQAHWLAQIWRLTAHAYLEHGNKAAARRFASKAIKAIESLSPSARQPLRKDIQFELLQKGLA